MRTNFTVEDVKNIFDEIFNGNLWAHKYSNGTIPYVNENSEKVLLINESEDTREEIDLAEYLNIKFYNWKERLVEKEKYDEEDASPYAKFEAWVQSLNNSTNEAYALVERIDEEVVASQDIDSATYMSRITFLIQSDKIKNLDYYITKIRNKFLGVPQEIQNSYGEILKAFILIGALNYDQEPFVTQLGECMVVSINCKISYLANAAVFSDLELEMSVDGDDLYDNFGNIVDINGNPTTTKYLKMPITKATFQNIMTSNPVTTAERPDLTGYLATAISNVKTLSFFDFNKELTNKFNDIFWRCSAYRHNGLLRTETDVNIPVFIRVKNNGQTYVYKDMIDNMQKNFANNDFTISSITLKGWGKIQ